MKYIDKKVEGVKIAYIGGGSRQWAWGLMSDLVRCEDMSGEVYLYDIDLAAAKQNEVIGNLANDADGARSKWRYKAVETQKEALLGADFVVISILPGTFDEMDSDVHTPEKFGIYQSVGDTIGPGGIIRALRTIPMYEKIALDIKAYCPNAWVINYTNPMTICTNTLYRVFPEIKAFGCCHEVFSTQKILIEAMQDILGIDGAERQDIKVNVVGVNHFTWITEAKYRNIDLFPIYKEFASKNLETGLIRENPEPWMIGFMGSLERVKFDLFLRYGIIAAAGDRHLAEFCPGDWYLESPEKVEAWKFHLTPVSFRKNQLIDRNARGKRLANGEERFVIEETGEDGVNQMRALLGLHDMVTNVNLPNRGQISNLPMGAVVETNAAFRSDCLVPVNAGAVPAQIYPLVSRISGEQELIVEAGLKRSLDMAFEAFMMDSLVRLSRTEGRKLFDEMVKNTEKYLTEYIK